MADSSEKRTARWAAWLIVGQLYFMAYALRGLAIVAMLAAVVAAGYYGGIAVYDAAIWATNNTRQAALNVVVFGGGTAVVVTLGWLSTKFEPENGGDLRE